jgi:hypothetical protein
MIRLTVSALRRFAEAFEASKRFGEASLNQTAFPGSVDRDI